MVMRAVSGYRRGRRRRGRRRLSIAERLANEYRRLHKKHTKDSLAQQERLEGTIGDYGARAAAAISEVGRGQIAAMNQRFDENQRDMYGRLLDQGLATSTRRATMKAGVERERNLALGQVYDNMAANQARVAMNTGNQMAGAIQSFTRVGPDFSRLYQLQNQLGQSGGASGPGIAPTAGPIGPIFAGTGPYQVPMAAMPMIGFSGFGGGAGGFGLNPAIAGQLADRRNLMRQARARRAGMRRRGNLRPFGIMQGVG